MVEIEMSETTSAKEMDDRERFRPSPGEIWEKRRELIEMLDEFVEPEFVDPLYVRDYIGS